MGNRIYHLRDFRLKGSDLDGIKTDSLEVLGTLDNGRVLFNGRRRELRNVHYCNENGVGWVNLFVDKFEKMVRRNGGVIPQVIVKKYSGLVPRVRKYETLMGRSNFLT